MKPVTFIQCDGKLVPRPYFREKEINVIGNFRGFKWNDFFLLAQDMNELDFNLTAITKILK